MLLLLPGRAGAKSPVVTTPGAGRAAGVMAVPGASSARRPLALRGDVGICCFSSFCS